MKAEHIWLNGVILPVDEARISPLDAGFQYGYGAFETLPAIDGVPLRAEEHLQRLRKTLEAIGIEGAPIDTVFRNGILELLRTMQADSGMMRVKVMVTRGELREGSAPTICITARPYDPPSPKKAVTLHLPPDSGHTPLARYKTLNYLYHLQLRRNAISRGFDDAIMTDGQGNITETTTSALLIRSTGVWIYPPPDNRLDSISLRHVIQILAGNGEDVRCEAIPAQLLMTADTVWITTAMTAVRPVQLINDKMIPNLRTDLAEKLSLIYFHPHRLDREQGEGGSSNEY